LQLFFQNGRAHNVNLSSNSEKISIVRPKIRELSKLMDSAKQILPEWKLLLPQKEQNYKSQVTFLTQR
jgi:hypothetical protein